MKIVTADTLNLWLEHDEAVLVDVREPSEHAAERIKGAHLLPLGDVSAERLPAHSGKILVMHCLRGARGQSACERLRKEQPELEVFNLEGGIAGWREAGLPVLSAAQKRPMPIDRQTQLTIGTGLLITTLSALFVHPLFVLLAGFFGAGLTFAGMTGLCGLARLLALMPWNRSPISQT